MHQLHALRVPRVEVHRELAAVQLVPVWVGVVRRGVRVAAPGAAAPLQSG